MATSVAMRFRSAVGSLRLSAASLRSFASASASASGAEGPGVLEWRSYKISFGGLEAFMTLSEESAELRKTLHPCWKGMFTCDIGGDLTTVHHIYHYENLAQRKEARDKASLNADWKAYRKAIGPYVQSMDASIFKPAVSCMEAANSDMIQHFDPKRENEVMYELRKYQLHPGYDSVPRLLDSFAKGLPHKVAADSNSKLVFFGFVDVGMLNTVIELWRYPSLAASIQARESARKVPEWRHCIGSVTPSVQHFRTQALFPTKFSPLH